MSSKLELENEINNRFLDLRQVLINDYPHLEVNLLLRIYYLENLLNGCAIVYNLESDPVRKESILTNYSESLSELYQEFKILQEEIKKISPVGAGLIRSETNSKS